MSRKFIFAILVSIVLLLLFLFVGWFLFYRFFGNDNAFLKVTTKNVESELYLNGEKLGTTPYLGEKLSSGTFKLDLRGNLNKEKVIFSKEITLFPGAVTSINYEFGPNEIFSSGDIRTFEGGSGVSITTNPKGSTVWLDGEEQGKTPLKLNPNLGIHKIKVSHSGFVDRELEINVEEGFTLVLEVLLAASPSENPTQLESGEIAVYELTTTNNSLLNDYKSWSEGIFFFEKEYELYFDSLIDPSGQIYYRNSEDWGSKVADGKEIAIGLLGPSDKSLHTEEVANVLTEIKGQYKALKEAKKPKIKISSTPTGTLNVRSGPSTSNPILKKVKPGEQYELLGEQKGWYKINVSGTEGWVSGQYAEKI